MGSELVNAREELLSKLYGATEHFGQCYATASDVVLADSIVCILDDLKFQAGELPRDCPPSNSEYIKIRHEFEKLLRAQGQLKVGNPAL